MLLWSELQLPCLLTERLELFPTCRRQLSEFYALRRSKPRRGDETQQLVDGFVERDVLKPAADLVPLGPLPACQPVRSTARSPDAEYPG